MSERERYTVQAGRAIYRDGKPFVTIGRNPNDYENCPPATADAFTYEVVDVLNEAPKWRAAIDAQERRCDALRARAVELTESNAEMLKALRDIVASAQKAGVAIVDLSRGRAAIAKAEGRQP